MSEDSSLPFKIGASVVILILMVPGLIVEPGPVSEVVGLGALGAVWGVDLLDDQGGGS